MFDAAGLPYAEHLTRIPNSKPALVVAELARDRGVIDALHPRLFDAVWVRGLDIGDAEVLAGEGAVAGLDPDEIRAAISDGAYDERIEASTRSALELGAGGVPAWLIDERVLVPGAQPHEVFANVLERLGHAPVEDGA